MKKYPPKSQIKSQQMDVTTVSTMIQKKLFVKVLYTLLVLVTAAGY